MMILTIELNTSSGGGQRPFALVNHGSRAHAARGRSAAPPKDAHQLSGDGRRPPPTLQLALPVPVAPRLAASHLLDPTWVNSVSLTELDPRMPDLWTDTPLGSRLLDLAAASEQAWARFDSELHQALIDRAVRLQWRKKQLQNIRVELKLPPAHGDLWKRAFDRAVTSLRGACNEAGIHLTETAPPTSQPTRTETAWTDQAVLVLLDEVEQVKWQLRHSAEPELALHLLDQLASRIDGWGLHELPELNDVIDLHDTVGWALVGGPFAPNNGTPAASTALHERLRAVRDDPGRHLQRAMRCPTPTDAVDVLHACLVLASQRSTAPAVTVRELCETLERVIPAADAFLLPLVPLLARLWWVSLTGLLKVNGALTEAELRTTTKTSEAYLDEVLRRLRDLGANSRAVRLAEHRAAWRPHLNGNPNACGARQLCDLLWAMSCLPPHPPTGPAFRPRSPELRRSALRFSAGDHREYLTQLAPLPRPPPLFSLWHTE